MKKLFGVFTLVLILFCISTLTLLPKPKPTPQTEVISRPITMATPGSHRRIHVFYYAWYATPKFDGKWLHWNHRILPHWDKDTRDKFPHEINYKPPMDIGANFYPLAGPYSSADPEVIDYHMQLLRDYVVVFSWWGRKHLAKSCDGEGYVTDAVFEQYLIAAEKYGTKIAIHLEPYEDISPQSVRQDIEYIHEKYGKYSSLFRDPDLGGRIIVYLYDSYRTGSTQWKDIFAADGKHTIRGTPYDVYAIGLVLDSDLSEAAKSGFDAVYTYFASDQFTWASTRENWKTLVESAKELNLNVSLSVGPGYIDTRIRPWNSPNTQKRENGDYYRSSLRKAVLAGPQFISITSFNEWHEGTQIEPVRGDASVKDSILPQPPGDPEHKDGVYRYLDYGSANPNLYMDITAEYAHVFEGDP